MYLVTPCQAYPIQPHPENGTAGGERSFSLGCAYPVRSPMSTESSREVPTVECKYPDCGILGRQWEFHHGRFCSRGCETRNAGRDALSGIQFDHKLCFTCFRILKEVEPAKPDFEFTERGHGWTLDEDGEPRLQYYSQEVTRDAATGFQYLTKYAGKGEKERDDMVITGTICDHCGNTDHRHHISDLADESAIERLVTLLDDRSEESIDAETLRVVYAYTKDIDLAVGSAIE